MDLNCLSLELNTANNLVCLRSSLSDDISARNRLSYLLLLTEL